MPGLVNRNEALTQETERTIFVKIEWLELSLRTYRLPRDSTAQTTIALV